MKEYSFVERFQLKHSLSGGDHEEEKKRDSETMVGNEMSLQEERKEAQSEKRMSVTAKRGHQRTGSNAGKANELNAISNAKPYESGTSS